MLVVPPMGSATTLRTFCVAPVIWFVKMPLVTCTRKAGPPLLVEAAVKYATCVPSGCVENPVICLGSCGLYLVVPT